MNECLKFSVSLPYINSNATLSISHSGRDITLGSHDGIHIIDLENINNDQKATYHRRIPLAFNSNLHSIRSEWHHFQSHQDLIAVSCDTSVSLFNASRPHPFCMFTSYEAHYRTITDIEWSLFEPSLLASVSFDGFLKLWDIRTKLQKTVQTFYGVDGGFQGVFNFKNQFLLASSHGNNVYVWDVRKGSTPVKHIKEHCFRISSIAWSHVDENEIVVHGENFKINVYRINNSDATPDRSTENCFNASKVRFTPFGEGFIWSLHDSRKPLSFHSYYRPEETIRDIQVYDVAEFHDFAWRVSGGFFEQGIDNRRFQLLTWGKDQYLRGWEFDEELFRCLGHQIEPDQKKRVDAPSYVKIKNDIETDVELTKSYPISAYFLEENYVLKEKKRPAKSSRSKNVPEFKSQELKVRTHRHATHVENESTISDVENKYDLKRLSSADATDYKKVPYPRFCGAIFSVDGLVTYFQKTRKGTKENSGFVHKDQGESPVLFTSLPRSLYEYPGLDRIFHNQNIVFKRAGSMDDENSEDEDFGIALQGSPVSSMNSIESSFLLEKMKPTDKEYSLYSSNIFFYSLDYSLMKYKKDLACSYKISDDQLPGLFKHNSSIANDYNLRGVAWTWDCLDIFCGKPLPKPNDTKKVKPSTPSMFIRAKPHVSVDSEAKNRFGEEVVHEMLNNLIKKEDVQIIAHISAIKNPLLKKICGSPKHSPSSSLTVSPPLRYLFSQVGSAKSSHSEKSNMTYKMNTYSKFYTDLMLRWKLLVTRAEFLKNNSNFFNGEYSLCLKQKCKSCKRELSGGNQVCNSCTRPANFCSICDLIVKGRTLYCLKCCHGGHYVHLKEWFEQETTCPSGCGCVCIQ